MRVKKGPAPKQILKKSNLRKYAFPRLMKDFKGRCAYSMQHVDVIGERSMEIDHYNPTIRKERARHRYSNLLPASRHCNGTKSNHWPTKAQRDKGVRILNPCKEHDYGVHILENPTTHKVYGVTHAGRYHVLKLGLNAKHLVRERARRAEIKENLKERPFVITSETSSNAVKKVASLLRDELKISIPPIPYSLESS